MAGERVQPSTIPEDTSEEGVKQKKEKCEQYFDCLDTHLRNSATDTAHCHQVS